MHVMIILQYEHDRGHDNKRVDAIYVVFMMVGNNDNDDII